MWPAALGVDPERLRALIATCAARGWTVATAESLTGGLVTALLTEVPGSSAVVRGGLVVYATELKHTLAGVDADLLAERGPVDAEVAHALAHGARIACEATIGLGLTGVAGPDPQDGVPVGTWFCAISGPSPHRDLRAGGPSSAPPAGSIERPVDGAPAAAVPGRADVRAAAARAAIDLLSHVAATAL